MCGARTLSTLHLVETAAGGTAVKAPGYAHDYDARLRPLRCDHVESADAGAQ